MRVCNIAAFQTAAKAVRERGAAVTLGALNSELSGMNCRPIDEMHFDYFAAWTGV